MADSTGKTRSMAAQVALGFTWLITGIVILLVLAHVFIQPVSPDQQTPPGHFGEPCLMCHFVSPAVDVIEFSE